MPVSNPLQSARQVAVFGTGVCGGRFHDRQELTIVNKGTESSFWMSRLRKFLVLANRRVLLTPALAVLLGASCGLSVRAEQPWNVVGPAGGDARAFAWVPGQPDHLYLGTTNSWLYESKDEGVTWRRVAKLDPADGFVLDSIVVDEANPATLYVGAWKDSSGGGLWISRDAGRTWSESAAFKGQPVHALAQALGYLKTVTSLLEILAAKFKFTSSE